MSWKKLLSIQSAIWGFMGSVFLCHGAILLSSEKAGAISATYYGRNPHLLKSLLLQKIDTIIGAILIAVAFVFQFIVLAFEDKMTCKEINYKKGWQVIGLTTFSSILISVILRQLLS